MSVVDSRGRLFGRINLVDAAVVAFVLILLPLGYGTYLLFRPAKPRIDSVAFSAISKEETRIASGALLTAKLKVRGTGFNPLLRASIGNSPALAFVFENPNSADVLVGQVTPDDHDLILFDGIQEVARAVDAYKTLASQPGVSWYVRGVGRFLNLPPAVANELRVGYKFPEPITDFEILALGPAQPARSRLRFGSRSQFDTPLAGLVEREAVLRLRCDSTRADSPCAVGARLAAEGSNGTTLVFAGPTAPFQFAMTEALPIDAPRRGRVQVRLSGGPHLSSLKVGDRDAFLDERAAVITAIGSRSAESVTVTLELGLDDSREGWRYRSQPIKPGGAFVFATDRYETSGRVETIDLTAPERRGGS